MGADSLAPLIPVFALGIFALVFGLGALVVRAWLRKGTRLPQAFQKKILLVSIPKEVYQGEEKQQETSDTIKQKLAVAESLWNSIGGLRVEHTVRHWFMGREDHIALEVVAHKGKISFYVAVPQYLVRYLEQQIHAQYPDAAVEEVEDYNIFSPHGALAAAYVRQTREYIFPIKTYRKVDGDPFVAILNSLSKLSPEDGAAIQMIIRSSHKRWHRWGAKVAREMQQGKRLHEALKRGGKWYWLRSLTGAAGGGIKDVMGAAYSGKTVTERERENKRMGYDDKQPYRLSPMEEEIVKGIEEKSSKAGVDTNVRVVVCAQEAERAGMLLDNITNAFGQYNVYEYGNGFHARRMGGKGAVIRDFIYRNFNEHYKFVLNTEELASIYHFPLPKTETPNILWLTSRRAAPPSNMPEEGIVLGHSVFRGVDTVVRMTSDDRRRHAYIIGMTGSGKSVLMAEMAKQDIREGRGLCIIDPHGSLVEDVLESVPPSRADDVVLFEPADMERPMGLNMLEFKHEEQKDFVVQEMISVFYKLFPPEMIGPMFEHNMRNVMLTLMSDPENPGTIAEIPRMFSDNEFQKKWVAKVQDPIVRAFWEKEMAKTSDFHKSEMLGYLISKVGRFVENTMMRNIIGQPHSGFDVEDIMNQGKIFLVNLSKGQVGDVNSSLLGLIIVGKLTAAAFARVYLPEAQRKDFFLYIDEFQNYTTPSIATILSEARKYRLCLILAHQYIGQLVDKQDTKIKDAVFGNVGTMLSFRIGVDDAEIMAKQFAPVFGEYDVVNIERFNAYARLLINNTAARPFSMQTYPPTAGDAKVAATIRELSRLKYGRDRLVVESEILERTKLGEATKPADTSAVERTL
ncbi:hypothetical protein A3J43_03485 [Candidatus Uhrbacteria bacterium RIFCSPHIGHO2_12_FULL_54_23]|uniref:Uncharacterized protein n=2 Tax=Candidatus Uhriibacteriota TaxID=1752732 RepID=A0A1F7UNC4_9BACT|nr:MAG: hypothetical protein A3J43_03485 [Candidatus Uhrbacteria bacterium RIFCSPHIGHO2_12_FULL_54_23]OGL91227.1 MAG: hypothetical protein A3J36_02195 [Candidatus Uhrbacteria bacterium RIFCSPLOWO2_02_FULL_54_37]